jgi:hypothetical protein
MNDVIVPVDLWEDESEAVITTLFASDGGEDREGDGIAELMVEVSQYELLAPASGKLSLISDVDDVVEKGQKVATIG